MIEGVIAPLMPIPPIALLSLAKQYGHIVFDGNEHYIKQTYRNRYHIIGPNGLQSLTANVKSLDGKKIPTSEVELDLEKPWQRTHLRTLEAAYRSSPFYDHYIGRIEEIIINPGSNLLELFQKSFPIWKEILKLDFTFEMSQTYLTDEFSVDLRKRIKKPSDMEFNGMEKPYVQVFSDRFPFVSNLSIVDLIFNTGPQASSYL